ncbi:hypothetical protein HDU97_001726 [Phlyctochytrium planicorne]|nr:hypothetical protein HDU97_001726 [Phlyctochytrium planicorne]
MSFLGTIGTIASSAVSRALGKESLNLPFTIGEASVDQDPGSLWASHKGTKKDDNTPCTVFIFDSVKYKDKLPLARNALKRFKTLRHPDLVRFIDGGETDTQIVVGTELVTPLRFKLNDDTNPNFIAWGLFKTATALKFINQDCGLAHGNIRVSSIVTTKAGEWKLCGLELLGSLKEEGSTLFEWGPRVTESKYIPPELSSSNWFSAQQLSEAQYVRNPVSAIDAWGYCCLIYEIFNGPFSRKEELSRVGSIPKQLSSIYRSLSNPNPKSRLNFADLLEQGLQHNGYFSNDFIKASIFLEQIAMKDSHEKEQFLKTLGNSLDSFPADFCKYKILVFPITAILLITLQNELINAIEFGGASAKTLTLVMKIGDRLSPEEYETMIIPCVIRLFSSPDRAMRVTLCESLGSFIQYVSNKLATEKIFPNLATGFMDTSAIVRESTLKAILVIIPKLSEKIINNDLLRYLAKLQTDEEAGIRANTTICLGKLAKNLTDATRKKVLIPAFTRSLHDPFPPGRNAGLLALAATAEYYEPDDVAKKVIPATSFLLVDPEKLVRTQAFKNMDLFVKRLEKHAQSIPETVPENPSQIKANEKPDAQGGDGWAGWAIGAISTRLVGSSVSGNMSPQPTQGKLEPPASPIKRSGVDNLSVGSKSPSFFSPPLEAKKPVSEASGDGWDDDQDADWGKPKNDWSAPAPKAPIVSPKSDSISFTPAKPAIPPKANNWDSWDNDDVWEPKPKPAASSTSSASNPFASFKQAQAPASPSMDMDDKEAAKKAKREQLAALREQKKAALAAKRLQQG